jgi:hypothetical protein
MWDGRKFRCRVCDDFASSDEIVNQLFVDAGVPFVLALISDLMALGKHSPYTRRNPERDLESLKYDVAICRPKSFVTKCGKRECVSRVIGEIEATFQRDTGLLSVRKSHGS